MTVVAFPIASTTPRTADLLEATLVFERVVDSVIAFQQHRGELPDGDVSPVERARVRDGLLQLLNELDPRVCAAAEARCAAFLGRVLPAAAPSRVPVIVADALEDYRRGLRQVPLRGVGVLVTEERG